MRRLLAIALLVAAVVVVLVVGTGASNDGDGNGYEVRAIFDNAGYLVPGEDVKVAGAKIGTVAALDVTPDRKAVVVLRIDDPAFKDFKQDASCTIRPQSLIGEKFVECQPTEPKSESARPSPPLRQITSGLGKGQYLLPLARTSSPVDVDLLGDVMRLPERQRFALILNELGTGLAGNGDELRSVIRRADPALEQTDRALKLLAGQDKVLADLATNSDIALAPLARERGKLGDFIDKAGTTATATAERGSALEANLQKLPAFLTQLGPTAERLGQLADQATPVLADLHAAAPSVNQVFEQLGPFSTAALPAIETLGDAADIGSKALPATAPVIKDVQRFATVVKPVAAQLGQGLQSLQKNHGFDRLADVILNLAGTLNGFDSVSHFLRAYLYIGNCTVYKTAADNSCDSTFGNSAAAASQATASSATATTATTATSPVGSTPPPTGGAAPRQSATAGTQAAAKSSNAGSDAQSPLLGYLLGGGTR
jgi:phospholipid/cholesterol/gamma-HCH transport system substrate-binding protein